MGYLSDLQRQFLTKVEYSPQLSDSDTRLRKAEAFMNVLLAHESLNDFDFLYCGMDEGKGQLYAVIGFKSEPDEFGHRERLYVPFTYDDLLKLQIAVDEVSGLDFKEPYQQFFEKLDEVIDRSIRELKIHEKTAAWVSARDGIKSTGHLRPSQVA